MLSVADIFKAVYLRFVKIIEVLFYVDLDVLRRTMLRVANISKAVLSTVCLDKSSLLRCSKLKHVGCYTYIKSSFICSFVQNTAVLLYVHLDVLSRNMLSVVNILEAVFSAVLTQEVLFEANLDVLSRTMLSVANILRAVLSAVCLDKSSLLYVDLDVLSCNTWVVTHILQAVSFAVLSKTQQFCFTFT